MKSSVFALTLCLLLSNPVFANERKTLFEGMGAKIVSITDVMTDQDSGVIFLNFVSIYSIHMAIYSSNDFIIWSNYDDLRFAFDSTHLIRIGKNKPFVLERLSKKNGIVPTKPDEAELVIKSLAKGEDVTLRYFKWPQHNKVDIGLKNPNFGFIYHKAAKLFGWKDLGGPYELSPPELNIHVAKEPRSKGYARVEVIGNEKLVLIKGFDEAGGGTSIRVGKKEGFGFHEGRWICKEVETSGDKHLIIRDENENVVFKEVLPSKYDPRQMLTGLTWPPAKNAALKAWEVAPLGSIEIEGFLSDKALLYGFRELWEWGVNNAGLPPIKQ